MHELSRRTLAVEPEDLRGRHVVLIAGGFEKVAAITGLLRAGLVAGLITDGDTALALAAGAKATAPQVREAAFPQHRLGLDPADQHAAAEPSGAAVPKGKFGER